MSENKRVVEVKKGAWSPEEDQKLFAQVSHFGTRNWTQIPKDAGLARTGKSCRLRWLNYLQPGLKRGHFTPEEVTIIMQSHELFGNKWSKIASFLPGRTDNEIKNYYHTYIRKSISYHSNRDTSESLQDRPKKLKQQKQKREIVPSPELSCENSSTISMDSSIDFPIMESYSPSNEYSSSSVSNTESSISVSDEDEDGWSYHQNLFAEPFSIEDDQLLSGINNSMAFFDENITWASMLSDHQLPSQESSYTFSIGQ